MRGAQADLKLPQCTKRRLQLSAILLIQLINLITARLASNLDAVFKKKPKLLILT